MVKIYKNGDDLGMVYCFNHIMGYFITNIMAEHPIGPPKIPMPLWDPWSGVQDYCNSNPGTTSTLLEMWKMPGTYGKTMGKYGKMLII